LRITGIHANGWTRERAIQYARENSAGSDVGIVSEVERFIAILSQALAYKIGELETGSISQAHCEAVDRGLCDRRRRWLTEIKRKRSAFPEGAVVLST
jgi:hypothetical protein